MEGKINEYGGLEIKRLNKMKGQLCPFQTESEASCGDWCPLFGEPDFKNYENGKSECHIQLCHEFIHFDNFTDEREK